MNNASYIFGNLGSGYNQFPGDGQNEIFKSAFPEGESGISIRRISSIAWCIYKRRLSYGKYIGFAVGFNGVCCTSIPEMLSIFDRALTGLAMDGTIIGFSDNGDIVPKTQYFHLTYHEAIRITNSLYSSYAAMDKSSFCSLPPVNYAASGAVRSFCDSPRPEEIEAALAEFNSILIARGEHQDPLESYIGKLKFQNNKILSLTNENSELNNEIKKVRKQKKRTTLVTILVILLAALFSAFMLMNVNLNDEIESLRSDVRAQGEIIVRQDSLIYNQCAAIKRDSVKINDLENSLENTTEQLQSERTISANLRSQKSSLEYQNSSLSRDLRTRNSEISSLKNQLSYEKSSKTSWMNSSNEKAKLISQLEDEVSELKSTVSNLKYQLSSRRRR